LSPLSGLVLSDLALAQAVLTERQISFDAARAMATAALETCRKNGYRVSVTVVDNAGAVRAAFRDDGTPPHTYDASFRKAYTARTYRISTVEFAKRIATESDRPGLAMIKDALGLPGGLPIKVGNETIRGVGVAGAPGGNGDDACAEARSRRSGSVEIARATPAKERIILTVARSARRQTVAAH
jgi:uncharacterized protein GlcG (DUF336 family)